MFKACEIDSVKMRSSGKKLRSRDASSKGQWPETSVFSVWVAKAQGYSCGMQGSCNVSPGPSALPLSVESVLLAAVSLGGHVDFGFKPQATQFLTTLNCLLEFKNGEMAHGSGFRASFGDQPSYPQEVHELCRSPCFAEGDAPLPEAWPPASASFFCVQGS